MGLGHISVGGELKMTRELVQSGLVPLYAQSPKVNAELGPACSALETCE